MTDMRKSRFTEQQIIGFLKQAESGLPVKEVCRQGGFSEPTFYKWRTKYGGMEADEARRPRVRHQNADFAFLTRSPPYKSTTYACLRGIYVVATM